MTILILTPFEDNKTANLRKVFGGFSHFVVEDKNEQVLFQGLTEFNRKTAWDYAFEAIVEKKITGPVAFVEHDVAGPREIFDYVFSVLEEINYDLAACSLNTKQSLPVWPFWNRADGFFTDPVKTFNPFCVMSPRMVEAIFEFKNKWGRYTYLEVLFASLAKEKGFNILDLRAHELFSCLFPWFGYKPEPSKPLRGICHPVKSDLLHKQICFETQKSK